MATQPNSYLTPEEYLKIERAAQRRSEYADGAMYAMAGASEAHNTIAMNAAGGLHRQLRNKPCRAYGADMRVRVRPIGPYMYPDVSAVCGKPILADGEFDTLVNPALLIEVLSPSTEAYDRGRKFEAYKNIESLREYLLLASDRMHADLFKRQTDGHWLLVSASDPDDLLALESVGAQLRLGDLYEKVDLEESKSGDPQTV